MHSLIPFPTGDVRASIYPFVSLTFKLSESVAEAARPPSVMQVCSGITKSAEPGSCADVGPYVRERALRCMGASEPAVSVLELFLGENAARLRSSNIRKRSVRRKEVDSRMQAGVWKDSWAGRIPKPFSSGRGDYASEVGTVCRRFLTVGLFLWWGPMSC